MESATWTMLNPCDTRRMETLKACQSESGAKIFPSGHPGFLHSKSNLVCLVRPLLFVWIINITNIIINYYMIWILLILGTSTICNTLFPLRKAALHWDQLLRCSQGSSTPRGCAWFAGCPATSSGCWCTYPSEKYQPSGITIPNTWNNKKLSNPSTRHVRPPWTWSKGWFYLGNSWDVEMCHVLLGMLPLGRGPGAQQPLVFCNALCNNKPRFLAVSQ